MLEVEIICTSEDQFFIASRRTGAPVVAIWFTSWDDAYEYTCNHDMTLGENDD